MPEEEDPSPEVRLLVVEDDAATRQACSGMLDQLFPHGLHVDLVASGERAVELLRTRQYHAIVADYQLEWMNGVDVLSIAARDHPAAARILVTGHGDVELAREALERARIHAFILKPLRLVALREALRHVAGVRA